ncbi:hypothetical protein SteCoe_13328 [Stentor coeruleus]|uniref:Uncharacterized protein n=1 Tax=Stentor coeruleus TaxID=5963 RepID=A0A1R2C8S9_9CILI|nr:hypothetical protein SteCoe_13328 [Stentor coeruleus]
MAISSEKMNKIETLEDSLKKLHQNQEFTKKLYDERLERQKRIDQRELNHRQYLLHEMDFYESQKAIEANKKLEEKQLKLLKLSQKAEIRKERLKKIADQGILEQKKPLYIQMEENYKQNIIMPELEQKKAQIAKKKLLYQPLDHEELLDHMKKYKEIAKIEEFRRKKEMQKKEIEAELNMASSLYFSKFMLAVEQQEKKDKTDYEKAKHAAKFSTNKRMQYSKIVKEVFPPIIDERKRLDFSVDFVRKKPKKLIAAGQSLGSLPTKDGIFETEVKSLSEAAFKPHKWKKNPMVPDEKPKKAFVKIDYLTEKRKEREGKGLSTDQNVDWEKDINEGEMDKNKIEKIKAKAARIEQKALKQERLMNLVRNTSPKGLEAAGQVNDMIISSIKAKLAILEKVAPS